MQIGRLALALGNDKIPDEIGIKFQQVLPLWQNLFLIHKQL